MTTLEPTTGLTRRSFLTGAGSLAVVVTAGATAVEAIVRAAGAAEDPSLAVRDSDATFAYLSIGADNRLTILSGKVELGTGVQTALTQIIVEQLPISLGMVDYLQGDTRRTPDGGYTAGSNTIRFESPRMRLAAATARAHLLDLAAAHFGKPVSALRIADGAVSVGSSTKHRRSWAELLAGATTLLVVDEEAAPVAPEDHVVIGTSLPRIELPSKLTNSFEYVQDVAVEGMRHARVLRPNGRNSHYQSHTTSLAPSDVVQSGDFVAVLADDEAQAVARMQQVQVTWAEGPPLIPQADLPSALRDPAFTYGVSDDDDGSVDAALAVADQVLEADYFTPYQMHGSFAPACAVADVRPVPDADGVQATVWASTQGVYQLRSAIAQLLDLPASAVHVIYVESSGCYGHMGADDVAGDAALASKLAGVPVRVQWMRQDEHGWEPYGPAMSHAMRAGVQGASISAWEHGVWSPPHSARPGGNAGNLLAGHAVGHLPSSLPGSTGNAGGRNSRTNYTFPADRLIGRVVRNVETTGPTSRSARAPLTWVLPRSSALRTLGGFSNCFANESFFDEVVHAYGGDPVAERLRHLDDPRARAVVEAVAKAAKWKPGRTSGQTSAGLLTGRGVGYNQYENDDSYVAVIVDVEVDPTSGAVAVPRAWVAHDCGQIINPDGLRAQIEGNIVQGVSRTLLEEVRYVDDRVTSTVWQEFPPFVVTPQYQVLRYDQVPTIEIVLIDRPSEAPYGAGEPAIGSVPGAIGNAVFAATGHRFRELPLSPDRVLSQLQEESP